MDVAIPTLFIILIYFMGHLRYTAAAFFANFFTVVLVQLVSSFKGQSSELFVIKDWYHNVSQCWICCARNCCAPIFGGSNPCCSQLAVYLGGRNLEVLVLRTLCGNLHTLTLALSYYQAASIAVVPLDL